MQLEKRPAIAIALADIIIFFKIFIAFSKIVTQELYLKIHPDG